MTSWTKRISFVSKAIYYFMTKQTVKPDIFYLWLSESEFKNKEKDLPRELLLTCNYFHVMIKWIKDNEYCHKRWYVYPDHYSDLVISIDDDVLYDSKLVETAKYYSSKMEKCIINCGDYLYPNLTYECGIKRKFISSVVDKPSHQIQLCGQCIVLPNSFPLEALSDKNINLRKKYCKRCDECWLTPFIFNSSTNIMTHKWDNKILTGTQNTATWKEIAKTKHIQLYLALRCNENNLLNWKKLFPKFNDKEYINKSLDDILKMI